jgi:hypothetical protein
MTNSFLYKECIIHLLRGYDIGEYKTLINNKIGENVGF